VGLVAGKRLGAAAVYGAGMHHILGISS